LSYPDEQIGYLASDQYVSRSLVASPNYLTKIHSIPSQPANESRLRKAGFPTDDQASQEFRKSKGSLSGKSDDIVESEIDDPIHVDEPKATDGEDSMHEIEDAGASVSHPPEGGLADGHGYTVPILASDEVAKEPGVDYMQPAVSPKLDRRGSHYDYEHRSSGDVTPSSRPVSRPGSIYGMHSLSHSLSRFVSYHDGDVYTPLEDVDEYEPLFPDEDSKQKAVNTTDRFKPRPDTLRHRFPSQDVWEDTPSSAMYVATVSTPDLSSQTEAPKEASTTTSFEHPDVEARRKHEEEKEKLVSAEEKLSKSRFAPHLRDDITTRPGMHPRFPSQDIWEDNPDSQNLVTTVQSPPIDNEAQGSSDAPPKPMIPPRPVAKSKVSESVSPPAPPSLPARPTKRIQAIPPADAKLADIVIPPDQPASKESSPTDIRKVPSIPDRPKPQIPPRPAKKTSLEGLSKTLSSTSVGSTASTETEKATTVASPPLSKPKPQVPARPSQSGKLAGLKGNFMNDLNQKLGLGPPKEKEKAPEPEVEQEAKPLEDARKGRARGPQRRAPTKSPSAVAESAPKTVQFSIFAPKSLWHISSDDGLLNVQSDSDFNSKAPITSATTSMGMSEKIAKMDYSTVADASSEPSIDTTELKAESEAGPKPEDAASQIASVGVATNTVDESVDESVDPSHGTAKGERPNPLERLILESANGTTLSQQSTASSGAVSGHTLERVEPDLDTDATPLSQHSTADSVAGGAPLETLESKIAGASGGAVESGTAGTAEEVAAGADKPGVQGTEEEGDYKDLEVSS